LRDSSTSRGKAGRSVRCLFFAAAAAGVLLLTSCSARPLIVPSYPALDAAPFIIGTAALGVLIGLFFFNLFLAVSTRESVFIYFSVILGLLTVLQTFSTFDRFFFELTYTRVTVITHMLFITFLLFFEEFFAVSSHRKKLAAVNRVSIYVIGGYALFFVVSRLLVPDASSYIAGITFIRELFVFYTNILFIVTICSALSWMRTEALLILIAFIPPALLTSLNALNIFPWMEQAQRFTTLMMQYNQPIGLSLQAILLSLATGNRYNRINVEREQSLAEAGTLKRIDRDRTEFYMNLSHELRTPLTIILGITRQLSSGEYGDAVPRTSSRFEVIERNSLRLLHLVSNMLQVGRPRDAAMTQQPIPVARYLRQIQLDFQDAAAARNISLTCPPPPPSIERLCLTMNLDELDTLVMNLTANALKYTGAGGMVTLEAAAAQEGGLAISVADTGIGIPKELQEEIFDRYSRLEAGREFSSLGAGLGLALVKEIITRCGGAVSVSSGQGAGSRFTLRFPSGMVGACPGEESSLFTQLLSSREYETVRRFTSDLFMPDSCSEARESVDDAAGSRPHLLVVEDNPDMCLYIRSVLSGHYRVTSVRSAREALEHLSTGRTDLIISDVMMPDVDGHEFLQLLLQRQPEKRVPLIFLTARDSVEEKIRSLREGAVEYLTKPFDPQELTALVQTVLDRERDVLHSHISRIRHSLDSLLNEMESPEAGSLPGHDLRLRGEDFGLTKREMEVFALIIAGSSDKEIARRLGISVRTVSNHNRSIYEKFQVEGRVELLSAVFSGRSVKR
jgi:signal transduction histidine kinase/DNA-binding NarL/FixJ family response regulator